MKNCPNCGAPIDYEHNKCGYCGTSYYDLACIPMDEAFFLRINVGENKTILTRVILRNASIKMEWNQFPEINLEFIALEHRKEVTSCSM